MLGLRKESLHSMKKGYNLLNLSPNEVLMRFIFLSLLTCSILLANSDDFEAEFNETATSNTFDPLSGYNEIMTSFNDTFYEYILRPVAKGYIYVVPDTGRECVSNVFDNLLFPVRFVNNLLQFKFENSLEELGRFAINSTLGFAGLIDVAKNDYGLVPHDEDFGQTLGYYGIGSGFHVVLPFLGPSNVRDIVGLAGDWWASPLTYIDERNINLLDNSDQSWAVAGFKFTNTASFHLDEIDMLRKDAIELYPYLRDIYEARRTKQISE